jgi:hypothetical protein
MTRWIVVAPACLLVPALAAQDGPAPRVLCDPADPRNRCPGANCACTDDLLAVRFDITGTSVIQLFELRPDLRLDAFVALETESMGVQGWSYGVRHDARAFTIESVTTAATDAARFFRSGFDATRFQDVVDCTLDPDSACSDPQPGGGFISAVVLSFLQPVELPLGTNSLVRVTYRVEPFAFEVAPAGLALELTERLAVQSSPPTAINITVRGKSTRPKALADGRIIASFAEKAFHRGDPDGDGRLTVSDTIALLLFLFLAGPAPGCLDAGDFDDDGRLDTTDPVLILRWLFLGESAPAPPGPPASPCGTDPGGPGGGLGCEAYAGC